jgi:predicted nucleotidyltransferase
MRLTPKEISEIKKAVATVDRKARVFLFGSRTDDTQKGGDIDLLVLSGSLGRAEKRKIRFQLYNALGEQKIDLLITSDLSDPFCKMAHKQGIEL